MRYRGRKIAGLSLVEAMIAAALISLVFGGLLAGTRVSLELIANSRAKLSAVSLANDRMEYFRSLPYNDVGTVAGIPSGIIPQNSTTTLNGIEFVERVLVEYVDDPADGQLTATTTDSNGIPSDYKRIKIEINWDVYDTPGQVTYVSNIVPRSIETTTGGGTVRVNVIDQDSQPLSNMSVQLRNDTTTSTVDVTRLSDVNGTALFSGAPAGSQYEVVVSGAGYSIDQTYTATTSNPNPTTAPFTVLESDISTLTFQIDLLSDLDIRVLNNIVFGNAEEDFSTDAGIATSSGAVVAGGALILDGGAGSYESNAVTYLETITPLSLEKWEVLTIAADIPSGTTASVQFFTASGTTYTLIPDSELPGNTTGFVDLVVDVSDLDPGLYPSVVVGISMSTTNSSRTPEIDEIGVYYRESEIAANNRVMDVRGSKVIGTDASSAPIYKYESSHTTDSSGEINLVDMEFDSYSVVPPSSIDVAYSCPALPLQHRGGENSSVEILLTTNSSHSLQVRVVDDLGNSVTGAEIELASASGSDIGTRKSNPCGRESFGSLATASDYELTVTKAGYDTNVSTAVTVDGDSQSVVVLTRS